MAESTCSCRQCQIRRAAFGEGPSSPDVFQAGINTILAVVGMQVAHLDDAALCQVFALIGDRRNAARQELATVRKPKPVDDLATAEVGGHG